MEATVKDGCKFKGIFHGASTEGDLGIALKLAQKIYDPNTPIEKNKTNPNPIKNTMLIFSSDLVEINAVNVDFTSAETTDRNSKVVHNVYIYTNTVFNFTPSNFSF